MKLIVDGKANTIGIQLSYDTISKYSGECSTLVLSNWASSFQYRSEMLRDQDQGEYDPLDDIFYVSGIEVNNMVYLERATNGFFSFSEEGQVSKEPSIIHGPDVINGNEDENLFLGVVTNVHNKPSLNYQWFYNGNPLCSGVHRCVIKVSEPGRYYCKVNDGKKELQSSEVDVLIDSQSSTMEKTTNKDEAAQYPHSVSLATLLKMGKIEAPKKL